MSLISLKNISKVYHNKVLFSDFSFNVDEGERIALIGKNGSGKSTLCRIITGESSLDNGQRIISGSLIFTYLSQNLDKELNKSNFDYPAWQDEEWILAYNNLQAKEKEISSNKIPSTAELAAYQKAIYQFEIAGGYNYRETLAGIVPNLSLNPVILDQNWKSCSGGEKMRLTLAKKISKKSDLLILDEPTNHLDLWSVNWLIKYLQSFKGTLILVSHDKYFLDSLATRCVFLADNQAKSYIGNYSTAKKLKEADDKYLQKQIIELSKNIEREKEIRQTLLSHRNISGYHAREKRVANLEEKLKSLKNNQAYNKQKLSIKIAGPEKVVNDKHLLFELTNISKEFERRELFKNVTFTCRASDKIAIIGANGSGKTTLLNILLGKIEADAGIISLKNNLSYAYVSQNVTFFNEDKNILEEILPYADNLQIARSQLAKFGFMENDLTKKIKVLSGGERTRLYLAQILLENPEILFLDEPTNHLDFYTKDLLEEALKEYNGAVILISHDRSFLEEVANRYLLINNKEIHELDSIENLEKYLLNSAVVNKNSKTAPNNEAVLQIKKEKNKPIQKRQTVAKLKLELNNLVKEISLIEEQLDSIQQKIEQNHVQGTKDIDLDLYRNMDALANEKNNLEEKYLTCLLELDEVD